MTALTDTREHEEVADKHNFPIPPVQLTNNQFVEENNILGRNNDRVVYYTSHGQLTNSQFIKRNNFAREFDFSNSLTCSTPGSFFRALAVGFLFSSDDSKYKRYVEPLINIYHFVCPSSSLFTRGYNFLKFCYTRQKDPNVKK